VGDLDDELRRCEHHVVELGHRGGDVRQACGEGAELAGLQVPTLAVAEGQRPGLLTELLGDPSSWILVDGISTSVQVVTSGELAVPPAR
jgi:hypothetical protein